MKLTDLFEYELVEETEFEKWFGDSKVVSSSGNPLVVYHGTSMEFEIFKSAENTIDNLGDGIYFSDKQSVASQYGSNVVPVYLSMQNPEYFDAHSSSFNDVAEQLRPLLKHLGKFGNDGIIITNIYDHPTGKKGGRKSTIYVVAESEQIKKVSSIKNESIIKEASAVYVKSLPEVYKDLPQLGKGMTSIVLDKGDGSVLMFTRDAIKAEWLTRDWGIKIGDQVEVLHDLPHKKIEVRDMPVYVIKMPKLFKLNSKNKAIITKEISDWNTIWHKHLWNMSNGNKELAFIDASNEFIETHLNSILIPIIEFSQNYGGNIVGMDVAVRNTMQDADGNIIFVDPIVSKELLNAMRGLSNRNESIAEDDRFLSNSTLDKTIKRLIDDEHALLINNRDNYRVQRTRDLEDGSPQWRVGSAKDRSIPSYEVDEQGLRDFLIKHDANIKKEVLGESDKTDISNNYKINVVFDDSYTRYTDKGIGKAIAYIDNTLVGKIEFVKDNDGSIFISNQVVHELHRRKGLATSMINAIMDKFNTNHVYVSRLTTSGGNFMEKMFNVRLLTPEENKQHQLMQNSNSSLKDTYDKNIPYYEVTRKNIKENVSNTKDITNTPKFKAWFGNSQVVDSQGNPLMVYHGSSTSIDKFDRKFSAQGVFWFTSDKNKIERGESGAASSKNIHACYLLAKNLAGWDEYEKFGLGEIIARGFDGIKLDDDYVVFKPNQIKIVSKSVSETILHNKVINVRIADLTQNEDGKAIAYSTLSDYKPEEFIKNNKPIIITILPDGRKYVLDGYHRLEMARRNKVMYIDAIVAPFDDYVSNRVNSELGTKFLPESKLNEYGTGRITDQNCTKDVHKDHIKTMAAKYGFDVGVDGRPPLLTNQDSILKRIFNS